MRVLLRKKAQQVLLEPGDQCPVIVVWYSYTYFIVFATSANLCNKSYIFRGNFNGNRYS